MPNDDDVDFDAFMQDRGIDRLDSGKARRTTAPRAARPRETPAKTPAPPSREQRRLQAERDEAKARHESTIAQRDAARAELEITRATLAKAQAELEITRATLAKAQAECSALGKERAALQRKLCAEPVAAPAPSRPSLREVLRARGIEDEAEATDVLLALLSRDPAELLDGSTAAPELARRLHTAIALVCRRSECQPEGSATVVHVPPERCEVCGGSDIKVAFEILLKASRVAGVTRLVLVGGSPPYHTQLRDLCRGTDLKLDLVPGHRKQGRRRTRNDAERVVIWGGTMLDHAASAAYDHLGDRLIRVTHRGISGMMREVARTLAPQPGSQPT